MTPLRVAVVGSRDYPRRDLVEQTIRSLVTKTDRHLIIISGGARGVDTWAVEEARRLGIEVVVYPADWSKYGKRAGFLRNRDIIADADVVVAFWDLISRGTKHSLTLAMEMEKRTLILDPEGKKTGLSGKSPIGQAQ